MNIAIWIIAIVEVVRALQNMMQLLALRHDTKGRDNAYEEFIKSLKKSDAEYVEDMLKEFQKAGRKGE